MNSSTSRRKLLGEAEADEARAGGGRGILGLGGGLEPIEEGRLPDPGIADHGDALRAVGEDALLDPSASIGSRYHVRSVARPCGHAVPSL
jgi:hypothetical protein